MKIAINDVSKSYPTPTGKLQTLDSINLSVAAGEFVSLIGPSGCGKSTLFNIISGLERPDQGIVKKDGENITGQTGHVGYMLQKDCLFPWRTVLDNAVVGVEVQGQLRRVAKERARELLPVFGLDGFADEYPMRLSGGMRQRVALLRTVMMNRDVWLLDEPFGALDSLTRDRMQEWLLEIWSRFHRSILFITHSIDEAVYLSDRVYVLSPRPARIIGEWRIDLPRPRRRDLVTDARFLRYKEQLLEKLHEQDSYNDP